MESQAVHALAQYALTGTIVASAVGGLVLCGLIVTYGFGPPEDEHPDAIRRRVFLTRLGHTLAAVCFALAVVLTAVALARGQDAEAPGAAEVRRIAETLRALEGRVSGIESVVREVSGSMDTLLQQVGAKGASAPAPPARR